MNTGHNKAFLVDSLELHEHGNLIHELAHIGSLLDLLRDVDEAVHHIFMGCG